VDTTCSQMGCINYCQPANPSPNATSKPMVSQPLERSGVSAEGRKHQRPATADSCANEVPMGALVEAGSGYHAQPNGMYQLLPASESITKRHIQIETEPAHRAERGVWWRPEVDTTRSQMGCISVLPTNQTTCWAGTPALPYTELQILRPTTRRTKHLAHPRLVWKLLESLWSRE